ncbi:hypothetical protein ACFL0S_03930 [Thermodesulfobacteriota bacterium]
MSVRAAAEKMCEDCGEEFTADQIRGRWKYVAKGQKRGKGGWNPPNMTDEQILESEELIQEQYDRLDDLRDEREDEQRKRGFLERAREEVEPYRDQIENFDELDARELYIARGKITSLAYWSKLVDGYEDMTEDQQEEAVSEYHRKESERLDYEYWCKIIPDWPNLTEKQRAAKRKEQKEYQERSREEAWRSGIKEQVKEWQAMGLLDIDPADTGPMAEFFAKAYELIPEEQRQRAQKKLIRTFMFLLHPDQGGSEGAMTQFNLLVERTFGKVRN